MNTIKVVAIGLDWRQVAMSGTHEIIDSRSRGIDIMRHTIILCLVA